MEIFIALNNTILTNNVKKVPNASEDYLVSINQPPHNSVHCGSPVYNNKLG